MNDNEQTQEIEVPATVYQLHIQLEHSSIWLQEDFTTVDFIGDVETDLKEIDPNSHMYILAKLLLLVYNTTNQGE